MMLMIQCNSCRMMKRDFRPFFARNMSVAPILYGDEASPPTRFVMMTALALDVDLEFRMVDLFKEENKTAFYKQLNPLQKVPVMSINGEVICDSHAIALRLCRMMKNNSLYPEENSLKSKVDEMLYFNSGVLFPIDSAIFTEYFAGQPIDENKVNRWYTALDYLELKLKKNEYLSGDKMRLSDLCCGTTVSSLGLLVPLLERHKKVYEWLENLKVFPYFKINERGLNRLHGFVKTLRSKPIIAIKT